MPSRRSSASTRTKGGQAGRTRTPPPKPPRQISWGVVAASASVAIFIIGIILYAVFNRTSGDTTNTLTQGNAAKATLKTTQPPWPVPTNEADYVAKAGVPVNPASESYHIHSHLDVYDNGTAVQVPANVGFERAARVASSMHTHDTTGVIHMENEKPYTYRLGQFFTEWGLVFDRDQVGGLKATATTPLKVYVNSKPYSGDPSEIVLNSHEEVAVVYGKGPTKIPSSYKFPEGE